MKLPTRVEKTKNQHFERFGTSIRIHLRTLLAIFSCSVQWQWQYTRDLSSQNINKVGFSVFSHFAQWKECAQSKNYSKVWRSREKREKIASKAESGKWWAVENKFRQKTRTHIRNKGQWKDLWLNFIFHLNEIQTRLFCCKSHPKSSILKIHRGGKKVGWSLNYNLRRFPSRNSCSTHTKHTKFFFGRATFLIFISLE